MPPEVIQKIVRASYPSIRACYEQGLTRNRKLAGKLVTRFVIGTDGTVEAVVDGGSTIPDSKVARCVHAEYWKMRFPRPERGKVTVIYPIAFSPAE